MLNTKNVALRIILASLFLLSAVGTPAALRCGTDLVSIGERSFEVLKKCKEPILKELIGFTITKDKKREFKIEEWIYEIDHGYYHHLIFEGNVLVEIKAVRF